MKQKQSPSSHSPQKKKAASRQNIGGSLLKKNEFTLIIAVALVVTVVVFFLFFRSPDEGKKRAGGAAVTATVPQAEYSGLEKRIGELEVSLARILSSNGAGVTSPGNPKEVSALDQRVTRMETALTLKLDTLMERMKKMEQNLVRLKQKKVARVSAPPSAPAKKTDVKKTAQVKKKPVAKPKKKTSLFHTVKKGETLWSISQKYKISVGAIRKLNNLTAKDKIYPGNNILVR